MPQFDPAFFAPQLFWLAIVFIALYVVMKLVAMPKIGAVLEDRQRKIDDNLNKAAELKSETDNLIALYEKALTQSRAQAAELLRDNAVKLAQEAEARQKDLGRKLEEQIKAGEARIAAAKTEALSELSAVAVEVAHSAANRLAGFAIDDAKVAAAVAAVIEEHR